MQLYFKKLHFKSGKKNPQASIDADLGHLSFFSPRNIFFQELWISFKRSMSNSELLLYCVAGSM
jgi:hypothetical protein